MASLKFACLIGSWLRRSHNRQSLPTRSVDDGVLLRRLGVEGPFAGRRWLVQGQKLLLAVEFASE